jgi:tRNA nucleotidyltransferase (CCA-adding enzyme)
MPDLSLVIGNKNYSSWSMRPWVLMKQLGIEFQEVQLKFHTPEWDASIERWSPSRLVPVLWRGEQSVWDSLAIMEALNEWYPAKEVWPRDDEARAFARSIAAEMHSGFRDLRTHMPMNIRASHPGKGNRPEVEANVRRIEHLWTQARKRFGAGATSFSGRFARPTRCTRPSSCASRPTRCRCPPTSARYCEAMRAASGVRLWSKVPCRRRSSWPRTSLTPPPAGDEMKTYRVGGSVRDELLGLPGAGPRLCRRRRRSRGDDPPGLQARRRGLSRLPPSRTHAEYALARTERKTGPGLQGIRVPCRARRDARGGPAAARPHDQRDGARRGRHARRPLRRRARLARGILRHVGEAFAEDPVRILRVARFAARFGFAVAPATMSLMRRMVESGEADALVPERVWQEVSRGLLELEPSRMLAVLRECGALARILPEIDATSTSRRFPSASPRASITRPAGRFALDVRYALLVLDLEEAAAQSLAERVNAPNECRSLALAAIRDRALILRGDTLDAETLLAVLERADAFRRPERLERLIEVAESDAHADAKDFGAGKCLRAAAAAAREIDAGAIAKENPQDIPGAIRRARLIALAALQK